jgi:hypothetical protein
VIVEAEMSEDCETPYWHPVLSDDKWLARIRADDPEDVAGMSDETIRDEYAHGLKYADVWDHVGDAREDWEKLADDWNRLRARVTTLESRLAKWREVGAAIDEDQPGGCNDPDCGMCAALAAAREADGEGGR